ncbi:hypothetical protein [Agaribacterium sp. ZY112]|uniref:hypothetical protein n=1 Tax=Agaribacterium sp. ZY112 TaxID=3233574 RepID=UPI0035233A9A
MSKEYRVKKAYKIDVVDPDQPLLEQMDGCFWPPFEDEVHSSYDLSGWNLRFFGDCQDDEYGLLNYASYHTDIYKTESYPQYRGKRKQWEEDTRYMWLRIADIVTNAHVDIGDDSTCCFSTLNFDIRIYKFIPRVTDSIKSLILAMHQETQEQLNYDTWFCPESVDEITSTTIKQREWLRIIDGNREHNWNFNFYHMLDEHHALSICYEPSEVWPPMHEPSEKALKVIMMPFWDFMDNLSLTPPSQERFEIGRSETEKEQASDDFSW